MSDLVVAQKEDKETHRNSQLTGWSLWSSRARWSLKRERQSETASVRTPCSWSPPSSHSLLLLCLLCCPSVLVLPALPVRTHRGRTPSHRSCEHHRSAFWAWITHFTLSPSSPGGPGGPVAPSAPKEPCSPSWPTGPTGPFSP